MFGFYSFHLKKLKIIELIFELARGSKILVVNNKDNRVFMSRKYIGLIVASWKFDVLKTGIFVSRTSNFRGATIS